MKWKKKCEVIHMSGVYDDCSGYNLVEAMSLMFFCYTCGDRDGEIGYQGNLAEKRIKYLILMGMHLNDVDDKGRTPINFICSHGKPVYDCVNLRNVNSSLRYKWIRALMDKKVNLDKPDNDGNSPLHHLCFNGDFELAKKLILNGANPAIKNKDGINPEKILNAVKLEKSEKIHNRSRSIFSRIMMTLDKLSNAAITFFNVRI